MQSVVSVCLFLLCLLNQLTFHIVGHDHSSLEIKGQQSVQKSVCQQVSTVAFCECWLIAVVVGFHCDVISCDAACGMAQMRSAVVVESNACGHGNTVGPTSFLSQGQFV